MLRTKFVTDTCPLVSEEVKDMDNPFFMEKVKNGYFEKVGINKYAGPVFKTDFCRQVYHLTRAGFTDARLAEFFGVGTSTISKWKNSNGEFIEAYMQGKEVFHFHIVDSLAQRALGYDYEEVEEAEHFTKQGIVTTVKRTKKHLPPDVGSIIFWLTNRQSDNWKNTKYSKTETVNEINVTKKLDLTEFSDEEQKMIRKIMVKQLSASNGNIE